jgi:hypothetical protein
VRGRSTSQTACESPLLLLPLLLLFPGCLQDSSPKAFRSKFDRHGRYAKREIQKPQRNNGIKISTTLLKLLFLFLGVFEYTDLY